LKKFKASLALADDPTTGSNNQNGSPTTPTPSKKQQKQQKQQKQEQAKEKEQGKQQQQQQEKEKEKVDETNKSPTQTSVPIRPPPPLPTPPAKREEEEVASSAELDKALHEWYSEQCEKSVLNDDSIKAKAEEINLQLYPDEKTRKQITNAWVCSWKRKHAIAQPGTPVSPEVESRREVEEGAEGAEGDKDRDEDEEMKSEGDSISSTTSTPPPRAGESEEKRRRKEIKRLRKDIEKRDIQMAKAKIRKEASLRRLEELERENAAAR